MTTGRLGPDFFRLAERADPGLIERLGQPTSIDEAYIPETTMSKYRKYEDSQAETERNES